MPVDCVHFVLCGRLSALVLKKQVPQGNAIGFTLFGFELSPGTVD